MEILAVAASLLGLMFFAYRGVTVLVLAPVMALLACLFHADAPLFASYTQVFMPALGGYLLQYFPVFLLGSIFGKLMSESGAAAVIGRFVAFKLGPERGVLAVIVACAVLTYGGVSLFVVAFSVYPIAAELFRAGQIPKRLIPAAIALGSFTFTMSALPGTPSIQNAIPMPFFGTTAFAAPGLGVIGALVMFAAGYLWLEGRARRAQRRGEGYGEPSDAAPGGEGAGEAQRAPSATAFARAVTPLALVLVINLVLSRWVLPAMDHGYLAEARFGSTTPAAVLGLWALIASIFGAILLHLVLYRRELQRPVAAINEGTFGSMLPIFNTASEVGYGATIASLSSFAAIRESLLGLAPTYPLISEAVSINILAGITGSASGGLSIALEALAGSYLQLAEVAGIAPELLHRVATIASGGLDTLPHNGAVITLLTICRLDHRRSYPDIAVVAVAGPLAAAALVVLLGSVFGSF